MRRLCTRTCPGPSLAAQRRILPQTLGARVLLASSRSPSAAARYAGQVRPMMLSSTTSRRAYATSQPNHTAAREDESREVPKVPLYLGAAGLIPFVSCTAGLVAGGVDIAPLSLSFTPDQLVHLEAVYGVSILSFMGAVHWGLAMAGYQRRAWIPESEADSAQIVRKREALTSGEELRYGLSVLPSLLGFGVLGFYPTMPSVQLLGLMAGFASVYASDFAAASRYLVPSWYLRLRTPLTLIVLLSLGISYTQLPSPSAPPLTQA